MERSGQVGYRQEGDSARGLVLLDSETRAALGRRRWRQPPLRRQELALTLAVVMVLHVLFALALWHEMRPKPMRPTVVSIDISQALKVRLIDRSSKPRALQPPEPLEPPKALVPPQAATAHVGPVTHQKPRAEATITPDHEATPAAAAPIATPPATSLFAKDGSVRLAPTTAAASATASINGEPPKPVDDRQIMQHDSNRMHYKATRFEKYFPPPNETAGGALGRHVGDVIKEIAKSVCDPSKNDRTSDLLCAAPPPPASDMDRDERLNLPPAPLANNPNPPKTPPVSSCIEEYKAGKPLPSGCPVNTPDLAFKAEMRECIDLYRAGRRLKTWCPADTPTRAAAESSTPADSSSMGAGGN